MSCFASSDSGDAQWASSKRHAPTKRAKKDRLDSKACDFATPHDPPEPPEQKDPQTSSGQCQMRDPPEPPDQKLAKRTKEPQTSSGQCQMRTAPTVEGAGSANVAEEDGSEAACQDHELSKVKAKRLNGFPAELPVKPLEVAILAMTMRANNNEAPLGHCHIEAVPSDCLRALPRMASQSF